ncbi:Rab3 GTPase-activating protein catalytic subunit [Linnemannia hyalina]|uniref:Rab3 GTPase-activating protein catalytic subunit n=1 Tax=Linnemannia hyalina TaxID=64524 RepID=A0A9P7XPC1_9FUNG|nr:Rab3 GTPase-activating protein catalytic subunit [Linnemannia hyalina]
MGHSSLSTVTFNYRTWTTDMDDFENFEFIDYTTSGPWERFITQIEDSLRSWGLVDNSLGVFDPAAIAASQSVGSDDLSTPNLAGVGSSSDGTATQTHSPKSPKSKVYQLREMLSLDDATYALSYQYHPAKIRLAEGVERIDLDFLPISLEGVVHHSLHRWTAQTHILIISPVTISDIFATSLSSSSSSASSAIIDLSSAKLLLSSFAIAFQNTGCNIPVFVPTGQPWNMTFTGLMIQSIPSSSLTPNSDQPDLLNDEHDDDGQAIEVRFNTVHVPYPPVQYTHLSGIMDYFIERMGIEDDDPASSPGNHSQSTKEQIHASALFSYDLVNWRDEDWKRWGDPLEVESRRASSTRDRDGDVTTFQVDEEPTMNTPSDSVNIEDMKTENRALSILPIPVLPFGPVQDPLKSLRLLARFASAPCTVYLDSKNFADMDASYANIWILNATFKEGDYGILSGIMEDAIASWSSESVGRGGADGKAQKDQTYSGALLNKGAKLIQGTITMVDTMDVENIVDALFEMPVEEPPAKSTASNRIETECGVRIIPASELGLQFKYATTIPYNSFLWRMIQYLIDVISPNSEISYATSVMGFLKVLWSELLKQFYTRWENSLLIPMVDIYGGGAYESEAGSSGERKPVAIDLRYNLLHQKLSMLNCCIARQIVRNKEAPRDVHPVLRRRKEKVIVEDKSGLNTSSLPGSGTTSPTSEQTYGAQFQNLLHGLSDISRPRSADVVPMAKRLLKNVKNRAVSSQQATTSLSPSVSSVSFTGSKTEPSSPTASMPIPQVVTPRGRHSSSRHSSQHLFHPTRTTIGSDDDDEDVFYDPMEASEVILDPMDMQRRAHSQSLTESFVALKYSSSADSQSGILVNDLDQMTVSASGPDPREVADPHKSEGGLKPLKDLKLLETGAPLMIPKLQEPGYMTEDMIQQQEELFETLGSSSDGAKMRAKMQSTQLISDMEAFKAANPGCVLGDFIRWHSPKDWAEDKRQMSARMADAGNYWQELWANSKRIPVGRQTPLFNYNQEAAKVLYYLDSLSGDQLFLNLLPSMFLLAYDTLASHPVASHIRQVAIGLKELAKELTVFPWNELTAGEEDLHLDVVIDKFRDVELLMGRAIALIRKFPEQYRLVERILEDLETVVEDGEERECFVLETFDPSDMSDFTSVSSSSPSAMALEPIAGGWHTRPLQRRMYACFKESEVRIVEAVAKDGMYM